MGWEFKEPWEVRFGWTLVDILISLYVYLLPLFKWCQLSSFFIETSRAFVFLVLFDMFFRDPSCRLFSLFIVALKESSFLLVQHWHSSWTWKDYLIWNLFLCGHQETVPAIPEVAAGGSLCSSTQFLSGTWSEIFCKERGRLASFLWLRHQNRSQLFLLTPSLAFGDRFGFADSVIQSN